MESQVGHKLKSATSVLRSPNMRHFIGISVTLATAVLASMAFTPTSASAQAAYGSYVGAGGTFGIEEDSRGEGRQFGGVLAVRYKLLELPVSLRAQALIGAGTAVVPTISYDFPLNWQTDVYLGAGAAFASGDTPSPVGDSNQFRLATGD
jgi:hypothetical protein